MNMFAKNAAILLAAYIGMVAWTLTWLFYSRQIIVPRNRSMARQVVVRLAILFALLLGLCTLANLAAWVAILVLAILWLLIIGGEILGVFGLPVIYIAQQYVLGFPDRDEWFLTPQASTDNRTDSLAEHVGKHASTLSALKPCGQVLIGEQWLPAASENGDYIDADTIVVVRRVSNGKLLVRSVQD
jgi:hypothetical protein